jgi:hypothetical protein
MKPDQLKFPLVTGACIILFAGMVVAIINAGCEADKDMPFTEFHNPLANPADGPPAGDPDQHWTTSHCQDQDHPRLTVQNLTFADGNSRNEDEYDGGGAIWVRGGRFKIVNCLFSHNRAIGNGANPAQSGTPGGGSGGAIYNDGNTMTLTILGTLIEHNKVNAHGSAIFFVTNDHSGDIRIDNSMIRNNTGGSWYPSYPGISMHSDTRCVVTHSVIE